MNKAVLFLGLIIAAGAATTAAAQGPREFERIQRQMARREWDRQRDYWEAQRGHLSPREQFRLQREFADRAYHDRRWYQDRMRDFYEDAYRQRLAAPYGGYSVYGPIHGYRAGYGGYAPYGYAAPYGYYAPRAGVNFSIIGPRGGRLSIGF